ncbi:hypothetical protein KIW84_043976 [Lathyrus oleraceus]|uniref:Uncharacterized protein n=1 Tax=Pisum sativum TaxID=3888 RepID=A0A9D4XH50_PEA|nr:hypothetical protein KIW84_043976 [Pisum sativum]
MAIGLCNLHTILDAYSLSLFLKTWSSICNGLMEEICQPDFSISSSTFPPRNTSGVREGMENKNPISFVFTSWSNMGFKEMDFGWGKPLWIAQRGGTKETIPNTVVLMETWEGIEAWVTMAEKHLDDLKNDVEFHKFAKLNPNINFTI